MVRPIPRLVVGLALAALLVLAGCSAPGSSPEQTAGEPTLGSVGIRNHDDRAHDVSVLIEHNGSIAHWETVHVPARDGNSLGSAVVASGTYVDQPGSYVVKAHLAESTTGSSLDLTDAAGADCAVVTIVIEEDGSSHFATGQNAYECQE